MPDETITAPATAEEPIITEQSVDRISGESPAAAVTVGEDGKAVREPTPAERNGKLGTLKIPPKTGRFQSRISDLVAQRDQARREKEELQDRLQRLSEAAPAGQPPARDPNQAPNPDDYETYAGYVRALTEWTIDRKAQERGRTEAERSVVEYRQERLGQFQANAAPLAEAYGEGFWDAITDPNLQVSEPMADAIMELDGTLGPYTMLYLASHPQEAQACAKLNPRAATLAIGRLAATLEKQLAGELPSEAQPGTVSVGAPATPPPTPKIVKAPRGSSPAATMDELPGDRDSAEDWLRKETLRLRRVNPNAKFYGAKG